MRRNLNSTESWKVPSSKYFFSLNKFSFCYWQNVSGRRHECRDPPLTSSPPEERLEHQHCENWRLTKFIEFKINNSLFLLSLSRLFRFHLNKLPKSEQNFECHWITRSLLPLELLQLLASPISAWMPWVHQFFHFFWNLRLINNDSNHTFYFQVIRQHHNNVMFVNQNVKNKIVQLPMP